VWGECWRFDVPKAAEIYDSLSCTANAILWSAWGYKPRAYVFPLPQILEALAADRQSIKDFRHGDREGAQQVDDYLEMFAADLDTVESEARRVEQAIRIVGKDGTTVFRERPEIAGSSHYGNSPAVWHIPNA
jgi:hypothetical protein